MAKTEVHRCDECKTKFEVFTHGKHVSVFDRDDDVLACPSCDSDSFTRTIQVGAQGIELGGPAGVGRCYPYYDRSLRMTIQSKQHRQQVCRKAGLIAVDSKVDTSGVEADLREERRRVERYRKYVHDLDHSPHFREYRELRDKGRWADQVRRQMEKKR